MLSGRPEIPHGGKARNEMIDAGFPVFDRSRESRDERARLFDNGRNQYREQTKDCDNRPDYGKKERQSWREMSLFHESVANGAQEKRDDYREEKEQEYTCRSTHEPEAEEEKCYGY
jgi:hypothetical protein